LIRFGSDIAATLGVLEEALAVVAGAIATGTLRECLEGPPVEPVFRPSAPGAAHRPVRRAGRQYGVEARS